MTFDAAFLERALAVAQRAADAARAIVVPRYRAQDFSVVTKSDLTPVTEADREAEAAIKRVLREAFPDHAFFGEEEGREYFFKTRAGFEAMIAAGELLEWAEVNGNYYGTPKAPVMAALEEGKDVLFDIDWQGARQVAEQAPEDSVRVFVLPPNFRELRARLEMAEIRISARDEKIEVSAETIALLKGLEITRPVGALPPNYAAQPPRNYAARLMARGEAD